MAAFEDNNPFASPASPTSSRANSYAPFGGYNYSPTSQPTHNPNLSFGSTVDNNRPQTSSSEDAPAYLYRATNSDFSVDPQPSSNVEGVSGVVGPSREKEGETCCKIDEIILKNPEMRIVISDAGKASDGGANFIAYTIEVGVVSFCFSCVDLGIDFTTTVFGVCFTERGACTVVSNFDYSTYP
jgi:hypothetical protein